MSELSRGERANGTEGHTCHRVCIAEGTVPRTEAAVVAAVDVCESRQWAEINQRKQNIKEI